MVLVQSGVARIAGLQQKLDAIGHAGYRHHVGVTAGHAAAALREAFTTHRNELVFLDFQIDQTENVYPMVQGGKGLTEMILSAEDL